MNIDKDYFLARLQAGEDINAIGQEMADMMNAALADKKAADEAKALQEKNETRKNEIMRELVALIQEMGELEGIPSEDLALDEDDINTLMTSMREMFDLMRHVRDLGNAIAEARPLTRSDDQILSDFLKMFN